MIVWGLIMGINMEVKLIFGVKFDRLPSDVDELKLEEAGLVCLDDCYSGEWVVVGVELETSQDNRYDSQDFCWDVSKYVSLEVMAAERLTSVGIYAEPRIFCFTYYS